MKSCQIEIEYWGTGGRIRKSCIPRVKIPGGFSNYQVVA